MSKLLFSREHGAPDGECDIVISAPKLFTNLLTGNKLGVVVKGEAKSSENRLSEVLKLFTAVDNANVSQNGRVGASKEGAPKWFRRGSMKDWEKGS